MLTMPSPTLVGLIGTAGAGKSMLAADLAREHAEQVVVLSLDTIRAALSPYGDESDQAVTAQAVARLHAELDRALADGRVAVVDATNAIAAHRRTLLAIAARRRAHTIAIVVLPPLQIALARNAARSPRCGPCGWARRVPADVVTAMHTTISQALPHLPAEGWHEVHQTTAAPGHDVGHRGGREG